MPEPRRVTLADVARKAGVHVTTVSLAMRNHPKLREATRTRLRTLAAEMGYTPDPMMQALASYRGRVMTRRTPSTLAYLTNWDTRLGWQGVTAHPNFHAGAAAKATDLGFKLEHFWMGEPGLTHTRLNKILETRGIKGLVIASQRREADQALQLDWSSFSAVKIDYFPHQPQLHNVTNDQCGVMRLAVRRVAEMGYRRIGSVMHRGWDHSVDRLWTAGFLTEQSQLPEADRLPMFLFPGEHPRSAWMTEGKSHVVAPTAEFEAWFKRHQPEAIISKHSFVAPCLQELGLRVPQDVAFVDVFRNDAVPELAGVRQNHETVGEIAVEILAGQLHNNKFGVPNVPTTTYVEGTWFDGPSCPPRRVTASD